MDNPPSKDNEKEITDIELPPELKEIQSEGSSESGSGEVKKDSNLPQGKTALAFNEAKSGGPSGPKKEKSNKKLFIGIGIVAIVVIALVVAFAPFSSDNTGGSDASNMNTSVDVNNTTDSNNATAVSSNASQNASDSKNATDSVNSNASKNSNDSKNKSSDTSKSLTITLSDVHLASDGWCFVWCKFNYLPSDIEDYSFEVEYYDSSGKLIKSDNEIINLSAEVAGEYLIGASDVGKDVTKVKVTVFDPDNKKVATGISEYLRRD